jgi:hypothetical protein
MKTIFDELVATVDRSAEAGLLSKSDKEIIRDKNKQPSVTLSRGRS